MLANMASSLILNKRITTTTAKAKALRIFVEPIITRSKEDTTHSRRTAFKHLRDKHAVTELFREVAEKVGDRPGGYTRIIKTGNRLGDNADMCIIELVDFNENLLAGKAADKPKTRRRRRGGGKKEEPQTAPPLAETEVEEPDMEETDTGKEVSAETALPEPTPDAEAGRNEAKEASDAKEGEDTKDE